MEEVVKFLKESTVQYFSTIGLDGKPKVRPFQFMIENDNKVLFCTSNQKSVYKEIKNNKFVEVCSSNEKFEWLRLSGEVVFISDISVKNKVIESSGLVKSIYKTGNNPIFEVFYLKNAKAIISDFSGNPPKEYNL
ncbi:pyridoxamine 5'-phosphate oxidase family protein [Paraclostridium bifermentans]|uniref:pyridoxamine 5'-phosphate oxidase family protein n=1 Tax=Paraclostridium bifermentans TaxID=1490 RepID=UPI00189999BE|nr:pyridoxamine 5'-phosphate oxidase family protein [Paraclostridium bifermentans]